MTNILIIAVVGLIVGLSGGYIYKEKKKGHRCIGCPSGGSCKDCCCHCEEHK